MKKSLFELVANSSFSDKSFQTIKSRLDQAEIICIDNVANYFFVTDERDIWNIEKDFPNLAPPFEIFFMEHNNPPEMIADGKNIPLGQLWDRQGVLFLYTDIKKHKDFPNIPSGLFDNDDIRWSMLAIPFFQWGDMAPINHKPHSVIYPKIGYQLFLDHAGTAKSMNGHPFSAAYLGTDKTQSKEAYDYLKYFTDGVAGLIGASLLAISFMHCKNVKILDFLSDRKKSRSQNRRGFHVTYKTLEITPMKKVLETEGGLEKNGLKKALHICRGHFKDYREVGLFGKFHDIYWWDSFIRGDLKSGIVSKDYQVNVPQQELKL